MEINELKKVIEALLFVSEKPLLTREIKAVIKEDLSENDKLEDILKQMQEDYNQLNLAFELKFVADGWTFATKPQYSPWIKKLLKEKTILKLSPSAMEVLAIIAYKQPITRAEIDNIRGVDCGGVIDTLTDRKFIKIVGRKESLGRPLLYGTTQEFLRHFGLSHLSELPIIENAETVAPAEEQKTQELPFAEDTAKDVKTEQEQPIQENNIEQVVVENEQSVTKDVIENEQSVQQEIQSTDNNSNIDQLSKTENTEPTAGNLQDASQKNLQNENENADKSRRTKNKIQGSKIKDEQK